MAAARCSTSSSARTMANSVSRKREVVVGVREVIQLEGLNAAVLPLLQEQQVEDPDLAGLDQLGELLETLSGQSPLPFGVTPTIRKSTGSQGQSISMSATSGRSSLSVVVSVGLRPRPSSRPGRPPVFIPSERFAGSAHPGAPGISPHREDAGATGTIHDGPTSSPESIGVRRGSSRTRARVKPTARASWCGSSTREDRPASWWIRTDRGDNAYQVVVASFGVRRFTTLVDRDEQPLAIVRERLTGLRDSATIERSGRPPVSIRRRLTAPGAEAWHLSAPDVGDLHLIGDLVAHRATLWSHDEAIARIHDAGPSQTSTG